MKRKKRNIDGATAARINNENKAAADIKI